MGAGCMRVEMQGLCEEHLTGTSQLPSVSLTTPKTPAVYISPPDVFAYQYVMEDLVAQNLLTTNLT